MITLIYITGSLGLFLYGMQIMGEGLKKQAGSKLEDILEILTRNRFTAVLTGFLATVLLQSSSASTVIIVGFVHGGLMNLTQAIGMIMGANIGTTITGWIVAILGFKFRIVDFAFFTMVAGMALKVIPKIKRPHTGDILIGFSILFIGLNFLRTSIPDIGSNPQALEFVQQFTGYGALSTLAFILFGAILTVIVQSSSAAMAITLTLAFAGWIDFANSAAIILGENIGTTVTAYIATLGQNVHSRRAARAHTLFNLFGIVWMFLIFRPFLGFIDAILPGDPNLPEHITSHLALFHSLFNIVNTVICIWFIPQFTRLVEKMVKPGPRDFIDTYTFEYIHTGLSTDLTMNLNRGSKEIQKIARDILGIFELGKHFFLDQQDRTIDLYLQITPETEKSRKMIGVLSEFIASCTQNPANEIESHRITSLFQVLHELDNMCSTIEKMAKAIDKTDCSKVSLDGDDKASLQKLFMIVCDAMTVVFNNIDRQWDQEMLDQVRELEEKIDKKRNKINKQSRKRMKSKDAHIKAEIQFMTTVRHAEHLGDSSLKIAASLADNTRLPKVLI